MRFAIAEKTKNSAALERDSGQNATKTVNSGIATCLYYYGARYLDPRTSRWISTDPAMGEYIPQAPISDEAKKHNQNLPGMGGIFNTVNMHVYHYAGNNPIVMRDPDGKAIGWVDFRKQESGWGHDAPQRYFGYSDYYDDNMHYLFDIQGTKFDLNGVTLRLWKGDYGMHRDKLPGDWPNKVGGAGGEIGFYNPDGTSMSRSDLKKIGLESTKLEVFRKGSGEYVASREEKSRSFWTTTFSWNKQGKGKDLYTINTLTFKDEDTARSFADQLRDVSDSAKSYQHKHNGNESITITQEGKNVIIKWGL
jgi:RHS repeat-associated protein